VSIGSKGFYIG